MGSVGSCYDNVMIESFWRRMHVELLVRRHWRTSVELANAIFEYLEIFHNRQRCHSALGMPRSSLRLGTTSQRRSREIQLRDPPGTQGHLRSTPDRLYWNVKPACATQR